MLLTSAVFAQKEGLTEIQAVAVPPSVPAGKPLKVTIDSGRSPSTWCGFKVDFGDGDIRHVKISNFGSDKVEFPVTLEKTYKAGGAFEIKVAGIKVTTHPPCPGSTSGRVQVVAPTPVRTPVAGDDAVAARCPEVVPIRNASGETVSFGLAQMVRDAGGLVASREQVARRIIEAQDKALDDKLPAADRDAAKRYSDTLKSVREHLNRCS